MFNLQGRIRIRDDGASAALKKIEKATKTADRATAQFRNSSERLSAMQGRLASQGRQTGSVLRGMGTAASYVGRSFSAARSQTAGLMRTVIGLGAAYLGVRSAANLVSTSIGGAAQLEMQSLQLEALVGNASKAQQLFNSMNTKGMKSVFSESDFLEGAKAFLPLTKNLKQIDALTSLQERLASSNPLEGMQGAAFSIREALSGDTVSLAERFNIPKSMLVNLRKATSMSGKIEQLDKILTSMGYTQAYLNKVNEAAAAQWDNLGSNLKMSFARSGKKALEELKPFIKDLNAFLTSDRAARMFERWGQALGRLAREAANFGRELIERGGRAFDYIDRNYLSNPAFQKLPFAAKLHTVFSEIESKLRTWFNGSGKTTIEDGTKKLVDFMAGALKASQPLIDAALLLGKELGKGIVKGVKDFAKENPEMAALLTFAMTPGTWQVKAAAAGFVGLGGLDAAEKVKKSAFAHKSADLADKLDTALLGKPSKNNSPLLKMFGLYKDEPKAPGKAAGIDRIPYNGFAATLHKDEMVLTKTEAARYREGQRGGNVGGRPFTINIGTMNVRNDGDIDEIARRLAYHLAY